MSNEPGKFAYNGLDRVLHEKARLGILTSLFTHPEGLSFNDIKSLCSLTDGNLSRHLQVLEREDLVRVHKESGDGRPQTTCHLNDVGRERYLEYLEELQSVLRAVSDKETQASMRGINWNPA